MALGVAWLTTGAGVPVREAADPARAFPWAADTVEAWARSGSRAARTAARSAILRFERTRRAFLPRVPYAPGPCDEIIGRFCIWHDDEGWEPVPEKPAVAAARSRLLAELRKAARRAPDDPWILGQRIRYLVESGDSASVRAAWEGCRVPEPGWCALLEGAARHLTGDFRGADSAFAVGLAALSPHERCRWQDLDLLLEGRARKAYGSLACGEREAFERRFWWLADPLYLVPGNERRTEHYVRRLLDALQESSPSAPSPFGLRWGRDLSEILLRYGWPAAWELTIGRPGLVPGPSHIVAHDPPGHRRFVPRSGPFVHQREPGEVGQEMWELDARRPRTHFSHPLARAFLPLHHQVARFRRGDTALVVAALRVEADTFPPCERAEWAVFLFDGPEAGVSAARAEGPGEEQVLVARVRHPPPGVLVGLETLCRAQHRAARVRYGLPLAPFMSLALSDLLIGELEPGGTLPADLAEAAARARPGSVLYRGERVSLYWEAYGMNEAAPVDVEVRLARARGEVPEGIALRFPRRRRPSTALRWAESPPERPVWSRSVAFDVPRGLPKGQYLLEVAVKVRGGERLRAGRVVRVRDRS